MDGYVYDESKYGKFDPEHPNGWVISAPQFAAPWNARNQSKVQRVGFVEERQLDQHWYHVAMFS